MKLPLQIALADDGVELSYADVGAGVPLVYLVGFGETLATTSGLLEQFAEKFRVVALERRGSESSPLPPDAEVGVERLARDLHNLLETLNLRDVVLVGYSMGGTVLFEYWKLFGSDRIGRVVIADSCPKLANDADWKLGLWQGRYSQVDLEQDLDAIENDSPFFRLSFFLRASTKSRFDDPEPEYPRDRDGLLERAVATTGIRAALLKRVFFVERPSEELRVDRIYWETMGRADFRDLLPSIDVPALITFADPGSFYSPATAEYMARQIPNATLAPIVDASHASFVKEKGEEFVRKVVEYCLINKSNKIQFSNK